MTQYPIRTQVENTYKGVLKGFTLGQNSRPYNWQKVRGTWDPDVLTDGNSYGTRLSLQIFYVATPPRTITVSNEETITATKPVNEGWVCVKSLRRRPLLFYRLETGPAASKAPSRLTFVRVQLLIPHLLVMCASALWERRQREQATDARFDIMVDEPDTDGMTSINLLHLVQPIDPEASETLRSERLGPHFAWKE